LSYACLSDHFIRRNCNDAISSRDAISIGFRSFLSGEKSAERFEGIVSPGHSGHREAVSPESIITNGAIMDKPVVMDPGQPPSAASG
jgi:hypothetical protein